MQATEFAIDVMIKETCWNEALSTPHTVCTRIIETIVASHDFARTGELSIALVNDREIQSLNSAYRDKDKPTNVLSFPDEGPAPILGDIVIALETVTREASTAEISFEHHVAHMLVHGFLHLQGYDHENDEDAEIMEALEIDILAKMNIDNPYIINERYK